MQFRAKGAKPQPAIQSKFAATTDISPSAAGSSDADATLSFAAFAPDAKPPAFQDAKLTSRSACADLQAASLSLSEVLKQVDAVLSQSAASPAAAAQVTLPSPSLRRVSVSNIVSTFEQNKISPPVVIPARENKRASFPPPSQCKEAEVASDCSLLPAVEAADVATQPSSPGDWTMVNCPAHAAASQATGVADDTVVRSIMVQEHVPVVQQSPPAAEGAAAAVTPQHVQQSASSTPPSSRQVAPEIVPVQFSPKAALVNEKTVQEISPAAKATPSSSAPSAAAVTPLERAVLAQAPTTAQNPTVAVAAPVTAPPAAGARYTFEDVERITTFAKEELQRRADAEVASLTTQLAAKTSQSQTLCNENSVLKDTLQQ